MKNFKLEFSELELLYILQEMFQKYENGFISLENEYYIEETLIDLKVVTKLVKALKIQKCNSIEIIKLIKKSRVAA
jgi:hypothetical protein